MCTLCGLPTTHATFVHTLGQVALALWLATLFIGAWWTVSARPAARRFAGSSKKKMKTDVVCKTQ